MKNKFSTFLICALGGFAIIGGGSVAAVAFSKNGTTKTFVQETDEQKAKKKIYSVEIDAANEEITRCDDAVGLQAGTNGDLNDFDHCYPWSSMKDVTVDASKYVNIDSFYFKINLVQSKIKVSISGYPYTGFTRSLMHVEGNKEYDSKLIGKYEASFADSNNKLVSVSGADVAASITLASAREKAAVTGDNLYSYREHQMLQLLYLVEFAEVDSQEIWKGWTNSDHLIQTGGTDSMRGSSRGSAEECTAMAYRGIENWYGNTWTWIDGICTTKVNNENKIGVSWDVANNDDVDTYRIYDYDAIHNNQTAQGLILFDMSEYSGDYFHLEYPEEGYYIGIVGGGYNDGSVAGAFCVLVNYSPSYSSGDFGFRLSRIPSQA